MYWHSSQADRVASPRSQQLDIPLDTTIPATFHLLCCKVWPLNSNQMKQQKVGKEMAGEVAYSVRPDHESVQIPPFLHLVFFFKLSQSPRRLASHRPASSPHAHQSLPAASIAIPPSCYAQTQLEVLVLPKQLFIYNQVNVSHGQTTHSPSSPLLTMLENHGSRHADFDAIWLILDLQPRRSKSAPVWG